MAHLLVHECVQINYRSGFTFRQKKLCQRSPIRNVVRKIQRMMFSSLSPVTHIFLSFTYNLNGPNEAVHMFTIRLQYSFLAKAQVFPTRKLSLYRLLSANTIPRTLQ